MYNILKKRASIFIIFFSTTLIFTLTACERETHKQPADIKKPSSISGNLQKPNILLVLTDDQGWGDLGHNGNDIIETPNLDQLFTDGASFERFYVSPVCSPTRASLLTGRHSLATGVFSVTRGGEKMRSEEITIAELLKEQGYATSLYGKWHNGSQYPFDPNGQGFDDFFGFVDGHITRYFDGTLLHNGQPAAYEGYMSDRLTDRAIDFMKAHKDRPFFTYVSFNTPHSPFELPQDLFDKYKAKGLSDLDASVYGMMENIDHNMGRLLTTLKELEIDDNTIVIYLSDNGPAFPKATPRYNGNMKGWKGSVNEGGVRVPFVIHWPGKIKGGRALTQPAQHIDLLPTLISMIGASSEGLVLHGDDLSPLLTQDAADEWPDRKLFSHRFHNTQRPDQLAITRAPGSVRTQKWLAVLNRDEAWELYDIQQDPEQKSDVSGQHRDVVAELSEAYDQWYKNTANPEGYKALPIEVGHAARPTTLLPAHEADITDDSGIDYQYKSGWAHDWITSTSKETGTASWPIAVVKPGNYRVTIGYAAPDGVHSSGFDIEFMGQKKTLGKLPAFTSEIDEGIRLYYTGEAPDATWAKVESETFTLSEGTGELSLSFRQDDKGHNLQMKYVEVVFAGNREIALNNNAITELD